MDNFDIVILLGPNDRDIIEYQIKYTKKYILNYENIYIVSYDPKINIEGCITIDENIFKFKNYVLDYVNKKSPKRSKWYFQQLLKLYCSKYIKNLNENYLIIDADTFFIKPTTFIKKGKCCYSVSSHICERYFKHMNILHNKLKKIDHLSAICHHMIFQKKYLDELFSLVEEKHKKEFYKAFLDCIESWDGPSASEYEIYFSFINIFKKRNIIIRKLEMTQCRNYDIVKDKSYSFVSFHAWNRKKNININDLDKYL